MNPVQARTTRRSARVACCPRWLNYCATDYCRPERMALQPRACFWRRGTHTILILGLLGLTFSPNARWPSRPILALAWEPFSGGTPLQRSRLLGNLMRVPRRDGQFRNRLFSHGQTTSWPRPETAAVDPALAAR